MSEDTDWRTSTHSAAGNCVQARRKSGTIKIRDSKNPAVELPVTRANWARLLVGLRGAR